MSNDLFQTLIGATLSFDFDYPRIVAEIESCSDMYRSAWARRFQIEAGLAGRMPFLSESIENYQKLPYVGDAMRYEGEIASPQRFYLKKSSAVNHQKRGFQDTKVVEHETWAWDEVVKERCPYTIACVESLPFKSFGTCYAFISKGTFLPTHRDYNWGDDGHGYDKTKSLGLSLVPDEGGIGTQVWNPTLKQVQMVYGNCTMFDDAMWHGTSIPPEGQRRITIRVFGEMIWDEVATRIVPGTALHV